MFRGAGLSFAILAVGLLYKFEILDLLQDKVYEIIRSENSLEHAFFCEPNELNYIFDHVNEVMVQIGSKEVSRKDLEKGYWNLLWSHEYINSVPFDFSKLKKHQKVNHIPGIYHLTSKSHLAAFTDSKYVPKGFLNGVDVMETFANHHLVNKNPAKRYVKKSKGNGDIEIKNVFEMNFENKAEFEGFFAQEYVEDPLLIDSHKFEFSVDVLITSIDPLRVYYYKKNIELLFTKKAYNSQNEANVDCYVIGQSRIVAANFPAFQKNFNESLNNKEVLNKVLRAKGVDVHRLWEQVEDAIRTIVSDKEKFFVEASKAFKTPSRSQNFFELVRFDFLLDKYKNIHVMEVNMSPNLYAGSDLVGSLSTYKNIAANVLNLIGFGRKVNEPIDSDLSLNSEICTVNCKDSCDLSECKICVKCMNAEEKEDFMRAFDEQSNSGDFRRVFPAPNKIAKKFAVEDWEKMTERNAVHTLWFSEMCKKNRKFC